MLQRKNTYSSTVKVAIDNLRCCYIIRLVVCSLPVYRLRALAIAIGNRLWLHSNGRRLPLTNFTHKVGAGVASFAMIASALPTQSLAQTMNDASRPMPAQAASQPAMQQPVPPMPGEQSSKGSHPYIMLLNDRDKYGRPHGQSLEDTIREVGPQGAEMLVQATQNQCDGIEVLWKREHAIRKAEKELRDAERRLANAQTAEDKKTATLEVKQKRANLLTLLFGVGQVALSVLMPGMSTTSRLLYGGMTAAGQGQYMAQQSVYGKWMEHHGKEMELYGQRQDLFDQRLELYDLRLELTSNLNQFNLWSEGRFCQAMGYTVNSVYVTSNFTPILERPVPSDYDVATDPPAQ